MSLLRATMQTPTTSHTVAPTWCCAHALPTTPAMPVIVAKARIMAEDAP